jgi:hypothetical protein
MQVVVFGAHDAPRERLALSYTSRRDHLGAECLPLHPRWQRASGERALQGASSGTALGTGPITLRSCASHQQGGDPSLKVRGSAKLTASSVARGRIRS